MRKLRSTLIVIFTVLFAFVLCLFAHESGHALMAKLLSQPVYSITFAPGVQLYPEARRVPWDGSFLGKVDFAHPPESWKMGLIRLMGCGTTIVLSYAIIGAAFYMRKNHRTIAAILRITAIVFAWDILTYSLPKIGVQHFIFFGGLNNAEPVEAAQLLEMPLPLFWILLTLHAIIFHFLFCWCSRKNHAHNV